MERCPECYSTHNRITPLSNSKDCLEKHMQYICETCGRYICIEEDSQRHVQRWNFPFKSLDIAMLYLRTAEVSTQQCCGIYEVINSTGRVSYKIFENADDFRSYLKKSKKRTQHEKPFLICTPLFG